jgi:hypothetical protein
MIEKTIKWGNDLKHNEDVLNSLRLCLKSPDFQKEEKALISQIIEENEVRNLGYGGNNIIVPQVRQ